MKEDARKNAVRIAGQQSLAAAIGSALLGLEFGWMTGLGVFFISWALTPVLRG